MMKLQFTFFLALCFVLMSGSALFAQWDSIQLPCRPYIQNLQVWQGKTYASSLGQNVFVSADKGASWQRAFPGAGFAINPKNGKFYRYTGNSVEVSADAGQTWVWWTDHPFGGTTAPIFSGDTLFFPYGDRLYRSTFPGDLTQIISVINFSFSSNSCFVIGKHVWAESTGIILHSPNLGLTWDTVSTHSPDFWVGLAASKDTIVYYRQNQTTNETTFFKTTDQGQHWTSAIAPVPLSFLRGGSPFLADNNRTWYSWNGLDDWRQIDIASQVNALKIADGIKIAGLVNGIVYEKNGQWAPSTFGTGIPGEMAYTSVSLQKTPKHLLFGGEDGGFGLAKRADGSHTWAFSGQPYFAQNPVEMGNQLFGTGQYGTYRADLSAQDFEWQVVSQQGGRLLGMNGALYRCSPDNELIYKSTDAGQTWTQTGTLPVFEHASDLANHLVAADGKFYLRDRNKLLVSENEGASWATRYTFTQIPSNVSGDIGRLFAVGSRVFLSYLPGQQVFGSDNNGVSFNLLPAPKNPAAPMPAGLYRLRLMDNNLFLYNGDGKFYRSTDWGQNWTKVKPPYAGFNFDAAIAGNNSTMRNGVLYLFDRARGAAWTSNPDNLAHTPCDDLVIQLPPAHCGDLGWGFNISVVGTVPGLEYTWFENGTVVQQGDNYHPNFSSNPTGATYILRVRDPISGCMVSDTIKYLPPPMADLGLPAYSILPCHLKSDTLDLSGSTFYPGIKYRVNWSNNGNYGEYINQILPSGQPANPAPPIAFIGTYWLIMEDPTTGCLALDTSTIERDPAQTIAEYSHSWASCGQNDGTAQVFNNGAPGITYAWSNGATTRSVSGLAPGWYSVAAQNGFCRSAYNFEIQENPSCKVKIKGKVWNNTVCDKNWPAQGIPNVLLHLLPADVYTFSGLQGDYEFTAPPGSHTVEFVDFLLHDLVCPTSGSFSVSLPNFGDTSEGNDFFVKTKPIQNLTVGVTAGQTVRGTAAKVDFSICNHGNEAVSDVSMVFKQDATLGDLPLQQVFNAYDPATHTAVLNIGTLAPGQCWENTFYFNVLEALPLGTVLHFSMDVLPQAGDFFPADNHQKWSSTVVGSFDPNDKMVSPGDTEYGGKIFEKDSLLRYTVRFQNTGNYPARTVEIRDTLDKNLDITSIQLLGTSHPYPLQLRFEGQNTLVFRFENIHLPDSMASQTMSQGFVGFSIKRKPNLPFGTRIKNRAGIYFDYNAPVLTNWVESVLSMPVGTRPEAVANMEVVVFPNPNTGIFTVELPQPAASGMAFRVIDLAGRLALEKQVEVGSAYQAIEAAALPGGLYFLEVVLGGRVLGVEKFVKQ